MANHSILTTLDYVAGLLATMLHVLMAAVFASAIASVIGLHVAFGREFLADFDDNGLPLLLFMIPYAFAPGLVGLLVLHGLLRISRVSRGRDLVVFVSLAAGIAFLTFLALSVMATSPSKTALATVLNPFAAYSTASGAIGGLIFWLLSGRWRSVGKAVDAKR